MENNVINKDILKDINVIELGDATKLTLGNGIRRLEGYNRLLCYIIHD